MSNLSVKPSVTVRRAQPTDGPAIGHLVNALADYEKLDRPTEEARERILSHCFQEDPIIDIWLAYIEGEDSPCGYSVSCRTYSSFLALPTYFMEDLFVLPEKRSCGAGKAMFLNNVAQAKATGCGRMEWNCLDWNQLARDFYVGMGAQLLGEWIAYRLTADQFDGLLVGK